MRVLFLIDSLQKGGKERRMVELIKYLIEVADISIKLILLKNIIEYSDIKNINNLEIKIINRKSGKDLSVFYKFYKILKNEQPDIVHTWGSFAPIVATPACYLLGIKFVNSIVTHAKVKFLSSEYIRGKISIPFSSLVVGNSYAGLKAFKVPKKKGKVIYNGYNFNRNQEVDKDAIRSKLNIKTKFVVGMIAAFHFRKDYKTYIEAAIHTIKKHNDITFLCIGNGSLLEQMKTLNDRKNPNPDRILFLGQINDVEPIIQLCDIGVLTTNTKKHLEGISNTIMEFMAQGKPVIATEGGGTNEIIVNNETGYLVKPYDDLTLSKLFLTIFDNLELIKEMGIKSKQRIENQFNIKKMVSETYNCYKQLLNSNER